MKGGGGQKTITVMAIRMKAVPSAVLSWMT
jgi:hypothetical protein